MEPSLHLRYEVMVSALTYVDKAIPAEIEVINRMAGAESSLVLTSLQLDQRTCMK